MTTTLVRSLSRLYKRGVLSRAEIAERVARGSIDADDYLRITGEEYPAEGILTGESAADEVSHDARVE